MPRYFAYGSNLASARLIARVPSARAEIVAVLDAYRWCCNKRGRDGSAKANIEPRAGARVWGVVYRLGEAGWEELDPFEGGYERLRVEVDAAGQRLSVETYASVRITEDERPSSEYRSLLLSGILEHQLPMGCRARVEALATTDA